jgi:hypothetical protein
MSFWNPQGNKVSLCGMFWWFWMSRWVFSGCWGGSEEKQFAWSDMGKWVEGEWFTPVVHQSHMLNDKQKHMQWILIKVL